MGLCSVSKKVEDVILVLDKKPLMRIEIQYETRIGGGTVKKIVDWLIQEGFAEEIPVSRYRVEVKLTEKGKKLAQLIKEIHKLLGE